MTDPIVEAVKLLQEENWEKLSPANPNPFKNDDFHGIFGAPDE